MWFSWIERFRAWPEHEHLLQHIVQQSDGNHGTHYFASPSYKPTTPVLWLKVSKASTEISALPSFLHSSWPWGSCKPFRRANVSVFYNRLPSICLLDLDGNLSAIEMYQYTEQANRPFVVASACLMWRNLLIIPWWCAYAILCQDMSSPGHISSEKTYTGLVTKIGKETVDKLGSKGMQLTIADLPFWTAHWWKIVMWWFSALFFPKLAETCRDLVEVLQKRKLGSSSADPFLTKKYCLLCPQSWSVREMRPLVCFLKSSLAILCSLGTLATETWLGPCASSYFHVWESVKRQSYYPCAQPLLVLTCPTGSWICNARASLLLNNNQSLLWRSAVCRLVLEGLIAFMGYFVIHSKFFIKTPPPMSTGKSSQYIWHKPKLSRQHLHWADNACDITTQSMLEAQWSWSLSSLLSCRHPHIECSLFCGGYMTATLLNNVFMISTQNPRINNLESKYLGSCYHLLHICVYLTQCDEMHQWDHCSCNSRFLCSYRHTCWAFANSRSRTWSLLQ